MKKCLEHQTPGWWVICPIDPAYYNHIEDCRIFLLFMNTYGKRRGGRGGENHKRFKCLVSWTCSLIFHENLRLESRLSWQKAWQRYLFILLVLISLFLFICFVPFIPFFVFGFGHFWWWSFKNIKVLRNARWARQKKTERNSRN